MRLLAPPRRAWGLQYLTCTRMSHAYQTTGYNASPATSGVHTPAGRHQRSLSLLIMLLCAAHVLASLGPVRLRQNTRVSLIHRSIRPFARVLKQRCLKRRRLFSSYFTLLVVVVMKGEQSGVTYLDQHQLCPFKQLHGCVTSASSQSLL